MFLLGTIILTTVLGGYPPISAIVVDAETGKTIEGAVVLVEWTNTHGIGHSYTESYKVVEVISGKDGKVNIEGVYRPFLNKPHVTVYKKGYVAWNDEYIFPDNKKRGGFEWKGGQKFKLEKISAELSFIKHVSFIRSSIKSSQKFENKKAIFDAFEWERDLARKARRLKSSNQ